ncbi:MAG: hypothetical protein IJT09_02605, partial [Abditibacteriota bacterium]|nr:hypothetical protein [Abditibacteriota bacterium]
MKYILTLILVITAAVGAYAKDRFLISFWLAPPRYDDGIYGDMAEAGFTLVFDELAADQKLVLDQSGKFGMKCLVNDRRTMAKDPSDPDFGKNLDAVVADYKDHPALWGYHLTDEPLFDAFPKLAAVTKYLKEKDPMHPAFVNLLPNYGSFLFGGKTFDDYVRGFIDEVNPEIVSYDHYALRRDGPDRFDSTYDNIEVVSKACRDYGLPFNAIVLSIPHAPGGNRNGGYRDPNEAELRWQVYTALAYGAKGIQYFCYHVPGWDTDSSLETGKEPFNGFYWGDGILNRDMTRNEKYYIVKKINAEIRDMEDVLLNAKCAAVYNTGAPKDFKEEEVKAVGGKEVSMAEQIVLSAKGKGPRLGVLPQSTAPFPADYPIQISGGDFTMGVFELKGDKYIMVVNRDYKHPAAALINFARPVALKEIAPHGKSIVEVTPTYAVKSLAAGDGILIKVSEK